MFCVNRAVISTNKKDVSNGKKRLLYRRIIIML